MTNGWPLAKDDHPLYYHSALVTRAFLKSTATTAGYDPTFMSGYAKSIVYPSSSTLPEVVVALLGGSQPELAYKVYVLISAALIPWMIALAGVAWRLSSTAIAFAVAFFLLYVWTDFPINYAAFGMLPYLLAIPLGLLATGVAARFIQAGGLGSWILAAVLLPLAVLVHMTSSMIVVPALALAYSTSLIHIESRISFGRMRHVGVWLLPFVVLVANAFWWLPGLWLSSTKGVSDFAFAHPEGVLTRLLQIVSTESPIESILWAFGLVGIVLLIRRGLQLGLALCGFAVAGFFWGYLAGGLRALDFLQPGRHTFAFYSAMALASGFGVAEVLERLKASGPGRLDRWVLAGLLLIGARFFLPPVRGAVGARLQDPPFLSSQPTPRLLWVVDRVKRHVKPGGRLLYEEGGFGIQGVPDPFQGGRFSGLLPQRTGVELIGGPYLHASLTTNFTQFGENKLFGKANWTKEHFVRYARLYRPSAILCWSPLARGFCRSNPDLIEVLEDDGSLLIARVKGFEGDAIEGQATVTAKANELLVEDAKPGVDGFIVLRYHSVPCLRTTPPIPWDSAFLEQDPVPFIRFRPTTGPVKFELRFPPASDRDRKTE
ncbi:hypothetical protein [Singulisphaera sp. PoT]|uniref:hypothetical protein n=1 Tax=Singulisphaera sp. PoT TaxID=3411797 RepID=UPI003BF489A6